MALLVLAIVNLAMVGVMAVAPVHLHHQGAAMGTIGLLVGAHIAAMYLPSPVTGWLADRFGARVVAGVGALLLLAAGAVTAVAGSGRLGVIVALGLLGVGWNAGLIGGSGAGLLAGGGFGLVSLVAVAPCLLLAAVAASGGRRAGPPPSRSTVLGDQVEHRIQGIQRLRIELERDRHMTAIGGHHQLMEVAVADHEEP
jgi:MFS family permease